MFERHLSQPSVAPPPREPPRVWPAGVQVLQYRNGRIRHAPWRETPVVPVRPVWMPGLCAWQFPPWRRDDDDDVMTVVRETRRYQASAIAAC